MRTNLTPEEWFARFIAFQSCARLAAEVGTLSKVRLTEITRTEYQNKIPTLPTLADFLCDFELAARAVLSEPLFLVFRAAYIKQTLDKKAVPERHRREIEDRVGAEVLRRKIYGSEYFFWHSSAIAKEDAERERLQRMAVAADKRMPRRIEKEKKAA